MFENRAQKITLFALRFSLGWMMLSAGVTKVLDPAWSPFGYLARAKTFPEFYGLFLDPSVLPFVTQLNAWGLTLVGLALILGIGTRIASVCGICLMLLYYFPVFAFPYAGADALIIDDHVIYAVGCALLIAFRAGEVWSFTALLARHRWLAQFPFVLGIMR